jgi:dipeptidyl aminopeptidase/acylaminoacyl peptidase
MRIVVLATALISLAVACSGCGGGGPAPRHGILFAHGILPVGGTIDGGSDIYVREPDGRLRRLVGTRDLRNEPSWSPDGRLIAFVGTACKGYVDCMMQRPLEVYVAHSDGSSQRQLTFPAGAEFRSESPTWSPNGSRIADLRELPNSSVIQIISVARGKTSLLRVHGLISQSAWGTPGIAYLTRESGSNDVFTIRIADPSTGRGRPFASPPIGYSVQTISWSTRAQLAALEASLAYESDLQRVAVYTGSGRRVARFEIPKRWVACGVTWSPDDTRLLLTVYRRGHFNAKPRQPTPQLYTVDPSGKNWQRLRLGLPLASCGVSWR